MYQANIIKNEEVPGNDPVLGKIIVFNKVCENLKNKDKDGWAFLTNASLHPSEVDKKYLGATDPPKPPVDFARWMGFVNPELQKRDAYHGDGTPFPEAIAWYVREMYELGW